MREPFIVVERGGWWHAYSSRWSWFIGREPILRSRTWAGMQKAVEELKTTQGLGLRTATR